MAVPPSPSLKAGAALSSATTFIPPPPGSPYVVNRQWSRPGPYLTRLDPAQEAMFHQWVQTNKIPFDPSSAADYDMRGFWQAQISGDKRATQAANRHFPDIWKTPFHRSFSRESMYALPTAPQWKGNRLIDNSGKVLFDEGGQ